VTIAFGAIGAKSAGGTTTVSVAYPTSVGAGDALILPDCGWPSSAGVNALSGWTVAQQAGGTGTAVDAHTTTQAQFHKEAAGGETGPVSVGRGGTPTGQLGVMARYTKTAAAWAAIATASGSDSTHGADRSITTGTIDLAPGDMLAIGVAVDTDAGLTITSPTISATGITFGTLTRRTSGIGVSTGEDGNVDLWDVPVTAGTGTVAVTFSFTTATTQCGPIVITRLREGSSGATVNAVTATATADSPVSVVRAGASVVAALLTATALALAPSIAGGARVDATAASATATSVVPTVSAVASAQVSAVTATATATAGVPTVSGQVVIIDGAPALASALALPPTVVGGARVTAVTASANSAANSPSFGTGQVATTATATATALPPTVITGALVSSPVATATALALPPTTGGASNGQVNAVPATATTAALAPVVSGGARVTATTVTATGTTAPPVVVGGARVAGLTATSTGAGRAPVVTSSATVAAVSATSSATAPSPVATGVRAASIAAVTATATATAIPPTIVTVDPNAGHPVATPVLILTPPTRTLTLSPPTSAFTIAPGASDLTITSPNPALELT
jgi:hypothetical protein